MKTNSFRLLLFLTMIQSLSCYSQSIVSDSTEVSKIANSFFNWYIASAKSNKTKEYNPVEIESKDGMTTLDFTKYLKNLKALSFSDSLIKKEKDSYNECIEKLSAVRYADFVKLTDLSDFEALNVDFTNYYRWTGGQEMFDYYSVKNIIINDNKKAIVVGSLYFDNSGVEKRDFVREITMTLNKKYNRWEIIEINY
jgi:hypothetical protein